MERLTAAARRFGLASIVIGGLLARGFLAATPLSANESLISISQSCVGGNPQAQITVTVMGGESITTYDLSAFEENLTTLQVSFTLSATFVTDATGTGESKFFAPPTTASSGPLQVAVSPHGVPPGGSALLNVGDCTPVGLLQTLGSTIQGFSLPFGTTTSLQAKLNDALAAVQAGDIATACSDVDALINEASAQSGKKLTVDQANEIIAVATTLKQALGC